MSAAMIYFSHIVYYTIPMNLSLSIRRLVGMRMNLADQILYIYMLPNTHLLYSLTIPAMLSFLLSIASRPRCSIHQPNNLDFLLPSLLLITMIIDGSKARSAFGHGTGPLPESPARDYETTAAEDPDQSKGVSE
jgi:hypothetical protein